MSLNPWLLSPNSVPYSLFYPSEKNWSSPHPTILKRPHYDTCAVTLLRYVSRTCALTSFRYLVTPDWSSSLEAIVHPIVPLPWDSGLIVVTSTCWQPSASELLELLGRSWSESRITKLHASIDPKGNLHPVWSKASCFMTIDNLATWKVFVKKWMIKHWPVAHSVIKSFCVMAVYRPCVHGRFRSSADWEERGCCLTTARRCLWWECHDRNHWRLVSGLIPSIYGAFFLRVESAGVPPEQSPLDETLCLCELFCRDETNGFGVVTRSRDIVVEASFKQICWVNNEAIPGEMGQPRKRLSGFPIAARMRVDTRWTVDSSSLSVTTEIIHQKCVRIYE
jgi:hypothetical protein